MFKQVLVVATLGFMAACMAVASPPDKHHRRIKVKKEYFDGYSSTCSIGTSTIFGETIKGSGVLLSNGLIITNGHVIDRNGNRKLDRREKRWIIKFTSPRHRSYIGTAVVVCNKYDLAVIRIKKRPRSRVRLITTRGYNELPIGEEVFSVGFPLGRSPAHLTTGILSSSLSDNYHRATAEIFYGSSGGGIFARHTGKLIGINTRVAVHAGSLAPSWAEYIPAPIIRKFLSHHKKLYY